MTHGQAKDRDIVTVLAALQSIAEMGEIVQDELGISSTALPCCLFGLFGQFLAGSLLIRGLGSEVRTVQNTEILSDPKHLAR